MRFILLTSKFGRSAYAMWRVCVSEVLEFLFPQTFKDVSPVFLAIFANIFTFCRNIAILIEEMKTNAANWHISQINCEKHGLQ